MSGQPTKTFKDIVDFRKEYMKTLALTVRNNEKNYKANRIFVKTGIPTQPTDTRTVEQRALDTMGQKQIAIDGLSQIMDRQTGAEVVEGLDDNELYFLAQQIDQIVGDLKPRFKLGVPADIFVPYFRRYMTSYINSIESNEDVVSVLGVDNSESMSQLIKLLESVEGKSSQITKNTKDMKDLLDKMPVIIRAITLTGNARSKEELNRILNELIKELPTRTQVDMLISQVEQSRGSPNELRRALDEVANLTTPSADYHKEINLLMREMESTPAVSVVATPVSSGKFQYIETSNLKDYRFPDLKQYLKALKDLTNGEITVGTGGISSLTKKQNIIDLLIEKDDLVRETLGLPAQASTPSQYAQIAEPIEMEMGYKTPTKRGSGLKRSKPKPVIDYKIGLPKEKTKFAPLGRYILNTRQLDKGIISITRPSGAVITDLRPRLCSKKIVGIFKKMIGGELPNANEIDSLTDDERNYLHSVSSKAQLDDKLRISAPSKTEQDKDLDRFEILRGQIIAGNDSMELIKEFKKIVVTLADRKMLPKGQAKDILIEFASKGF